MSMQKLQEFTAYQKALDLFDLVVADMQRLHDVHDTMRLRSQQIASADSICSNMEEGAGRWSTTEYTHYQVIARGFAAKTMGRCKRMRHWLPADIVAGRVDRCDEIIAILTASISKLKRRQR